MGVIQILMLREVLAKVVELERLRLVGSVGKEGRTGKCEEAYKVKTRETTSIDVEVERLRWGHDVKGLSWPVFRWLFNRRDALKGIHVQQLGPFKRINLRCKV